MRVFYSLTPTSPFLPDERHRKLVDESIHHFKYLDSPVVPALYHGSRTGDQEPESHPLPSDHARSVSMAVKEDALKTQTNMPFFHKEERWPSC